MSQNAVVLATEVKLRSPHSCLATLAGLGIDAFEVRDLKIPDAKPLAFIPRKATAPG